MRRAVCALLVPLLLAGCASSGGLAGAPDRSEPLVIAGGAERAPLRKGHECLDDSGDNDPFGRFNRAVYRFNARFDEAVFLPVSKGYKRVFPRPVRTGVNNFFSNLGEVRNTLNHALQGRVDRSGASLARLLINTTVGLAGVLDPASEIGLRRMPTGFGHTLARWGVGPGPYLVLPLAGPSNLRDAGGLAADFGVAYSVNAGGLYQSRNSWALGTTMAIDTRSNVDFRYYASGSPFEYEIVRFLHSRKRMIESGVLLPPSEECE